MGVVMNLVTNLIALGLDAGILALCCEGVFWTEIQWKDKRTSAPSHTFSALYHTEGECDCRQGKMTASIPVQGVEIVPVDGIVGLLFLIFFSVLLLNSIFFSQRSSGHIFCGTMAVSPSTSLSSA